MEHTALNEYYRAEDWFRRAAYPKRNTRGEGGVRWNLTIFRLFYL